MGDEYDYQEYEDSYGNGDNDGEIDFDEPDEADIHEEAEEEDFKEEFGAFARAGSSSVFNKFPETEEEFFYQNMVSYALRVGAVSDVNELRKVFSTLVKNYPHPRFLNPGACLAMRTFYTTTGYTWDKDVFLRHKRDLLNLSEFTLIRYIALFNKYN